MSRLAPSALIACPHCQYVALKKRVSSFSSGDLTRWSDGYVESWFGQPSFTRCGRCKGVFWLEDAEQVGELPVGNSQPKRTRPKWLSWFFGRGEITHYQSEAVPDAWKWAQPIEHPDIDAVVIGVEALADASKKQEQRMRRLLWWKINDQYRNPRTTSRPISEAIREKHEQSNLLRLLELSYQDGQPCIETVEIFRELGRFDEARIALGQINPDIRGFDVIAKKIGEQDCRVCVIQESALNS